jgi:hypothetical protein
MPIDETAEQCLPICLGMILGYSGSQLKAGTLKHIEARYQKPSRGSGELTSLYFY